MKHLLIGSFAIGAILASLGCGKSEAARGGDAIASSGAAAPGDAQPAAAKSSAGAPSVLIKLSQFGYSEYCSIATGADGTIHALFTDARAFGKPHYAFYRASKDGGATWSEAKNLSDDESPLGSSWCQIKLDGKGRAYAIWKYINGSIAQDGAGGADGGILAYRCLDGGNWTKTVRIGDEHHPVTSWFAATGPDGSMHLVWSQGQQDFDFAGKGGLAYYCDDIKHAVLNGGAAPQPIALVSASPAQDRPNDDGLWNLRGYIAADGNPHFIGAHDKTHSGGCEVIYRFDGAKAAPFYEYKTDPQGNTFHDPPAMVLEADGKEHIIRKPEVSEVQALRDYPVDGNAPGEGTNVISNPADKAAIFDWQVSSLAGGKVAAMAALSPEGMYDRGCDLYVAIGDGEGNWSKPINVTDNDARAKFFAKAAVSQSSSYRPTFSDAAALRSGELGILMVNTEHSITGLNTVGVTGTGETVTGLATAGSENPYVFFTKVKG